MYLGKNFWKERLYQETTLATHGKRLEHQRHYRRRNTALRCRFAVTCIPSGVRAGLGRRDARRSQQGQGTSQNSIRSKGTSKRASWPAARERPQLRRDCCLRPQFR